MKHIPIVATAVLLLVAASSLAQSLPRPPAAGQKVNVNTASETELRTLPGIGHEEAMRIIAGRPYSSIARFLRVARLPLDQAQAAQARIVVSDEPARAPVSAPAEKPPARKQARSTGSGQALSNDEFQASIARRKDILVNVNTATEAELKTLPGVDHEAARRIIAGRPYANVPKFLDALKLPPDAAQRIAVKVGTGQPPAAEPPIPKKAFLPPSSSDGTASSSSEKSATAKPSPGSNIPETGRPPLRPEEKADVNSASLEELKRKGGLDPRVVWKIIANRPYRSLSDLSKAGLGHDEIVRLSHFYRVFPRK